MAVGGVGYSTFTGSPFWVGVGGGGRLRVRVPRETHVGRVFGARWNARKF